MSVSTIINLIGAACLPLVILVVNRIADRATKRQDKLIERRAKELARRNEL